jgi:hypothetical protein
MARWSLYVTRENPEPISNHNRRKADFSDKSHVRDSVCSYFSLHCSSFPIDHVRLEESWEFAQCRISQTFQLAHWLCSISGSRLSCLITNSTVWLSPGSLISIQVDTPQKEMQYCHGHQSDEIVNPIHFHLVLLTHSPAIRRSLSVAALSILLRGKHLVVCLRSFNGSSKSPFSFLPLSFWSELCHFCPKPLSLNHEMF